jgi:hypothetical protein
MSTRDGIWRNLQLAAKSLDNKEFLSWLLDRFDPEDMTIQIGAK